MNPTPDPQAASSTVDEALILSTKNKVNLKRKGASDFVPVLRRVGFRIGDLLQVGDASTATVLCQKWTCDLGPNTYSSCCAASCPNSIAMVRSAEQNDLPVIPKGELPASEAAALAQAESRLRGLELGPVTTQFLITTLYSNWRLVEADRELEQLSNQLDTPAAKQELQGLYNSVVTRSGNMNMRFNRIGDAKKLYLLGIKTDVPDQDPREKAAAHVGLADTYIKSGSQTDAIKSLEKARDIYVKEGDAQAVSATEKQIQTTRANRDLQRSRIKPN
ncbi:MAG: hypothetical protein ACXWID_18245 [Pyrinomonadaceae bacterium]